MVTGVIGSTGPTLTTLGNTNPIDMRSLEYLEGLVRPQDPRKHYSHRYVSTGVLGRIGPDRWSLGTFNPIDM